MARYPEKKKEVKSLIRLNIIRVRREEKVSKFYESLPIAPLIEKLESEVSNIGFRLIKESPRSKEYFQLLDDAVDLETINEIDKQIFPEEKKLFDIISEIKTVLEKHIEPLVEQKSIASQKRPP